VLSGRCLCFGLIARSSPTECGVAECDSEASKMGGPGPLEALAK
jgi:hypothetical protein